MDTFWYKKNTKMEKILYFSVFRSRREVNKQLFVTG